MFERGNTIEQIAYQRYQLHWIMTHGYGISDFDDMAADWWNAKLSDPNYDDSFSDYLEENGFQGSLYASFAEFMQAEYVDRECIRSLLSEAEYAVYLSAAWGDNNQATTTEVHTCSEIRYPVLVDADACRGLEYLELPAGEAVIFDERGIDYNEYEHAWRPWESAEVFLGFYHGQTQQQALEAASEEQNMPICFLKIAR